jgi:anti-sigma factor RsiW
MKPEEVKDLLPWYAAGSLEPEQARQVEAVLKDAPQLARELDEWRALESVVAEVGENEPEFRPELIDEAHRRIDAYEAGRASAGSARSASRAQTGAASVTTLLGRVRRTWDATPVGVRFAMAAQLGLLAVLVGLLGVPRLEDPGFTTASGTRSQSVEGRRVSVVFQPERSLGEIEALLEDAGAEIVAGPSGQGAYVLDLGDVDDAQAARVLDELRANAALVRYAAPLE